VCFHSFVSIVLNSYKGEVFHMGEIMVTKCGIEGLHVIEPKVFTDSRGYFFESYNQRDMEVLGFDMKFVQDNQSKSVKGVLRGMHFQKRHPQGKLVRVISGSVYDVAIDLRAGSATYGRWFGVELTSGNRKQFYIPKGFAHGFLVLSDVAEFCYKCTEYYHPEDTGGIRYDDPDIGIAWPEVGVDLTMSAKDRELPYLSESKMAFVF